MGNKAQYLSDEQWIALIGIVNEPTGYKVQFPEEGGGDAVVKHFSGVLWTIKADGTVEQGMWAEDAS